MAVGDGQDVDNSVANARLTLRMGVYHFHRWFEGYLGIPVLGDCATQLERDFQSHIYFFIKQIKKVSKLTA